MTQPTQSSRPMLLGAMLLGALLIAAGVTWYFRWGPGAGPQLPRPGSPAYEEYAEAFQVGVAGLDVARNEIAEENLTRAVETIPQEPAAWADRGLFYLRTNNLARAQQDLQQAHKLAPESAEIDGLLGLLAKQQGNYSEAVRLLRKAVEDRPEDLVARYTLVEWLQQEKAGKDAEIQGLLDDILKVQPNNLFVLKEKGLITLQRGDEAAFQDVLHRFDQLSLGWSKDTREKLTDLKKSVVKGLSNDAIFHMQVLSNVLQQEPGFARDASAVKRRTTLGTSIQHFLRLEPLRPFPAPADLELQFSPETLPAPGMKTGGNLLQAVWLRQDSGPATFAAAGKEVRRIDGPGLTLDFPGGPRALAPTPNGLLAIDWNNDSRTDLLLAGAGGLRFHEQADDGSFANVTDKTGLEKAVLQADYYGAWAADIDMDGDLDIIVAPREKEAFVLRNNSDGTFKVVKLFPRVEGARAFVWADLDNDGALDATFLDAQGKLYVFANERSSQFRKRSVPDDLGKLVALTASDVTDDGVFDLLAMRTDGSVVRLSDQDKGKGWQTGNLVSWPEMPSDSSPGDCRLLMADLDNNGSLDLVATFPGGTRIWLSETTDKWTPLPASPEKTVLSIADVTGDGRLDLLSFSQDGKPLRLVNHGARSYHWQVVKPRAVPKGQASGDDRINSFGIGGEVELRTGTLVQKQIIDAPVVHFGLGDKARADVLRFTWTNALSQVEFAQDADQVVQVEQRLFSSCPFLFTYDGKGMQFVTDFLWSTPLGLNINGQPKAAFSQTEEWIKVRGDQLLPRDGYYDVRITAELWEAHFFDYLSLRVMDHPPGTEMFVDERFAITPLPLHVHLTTPPRPVARARDEQGQDVTDLVRSTDGRYLDTFERGQYQGVARDHWVEAELGEDIPGDGPVWLLAHGWVRPTDSSINAALSQGRHEQPRPLVLEVPDGKGGWKVEQPALGFPAGKNKTMLIRLDRGHGKDVIRRFRLRTNLEVYWDSLSYARGFDSRKARQQTLTPEAADLRYMGFLEMTQANESSPELPHYDRLVGTAPRWRDLIGYYTRYGDVRELLHKTDDRYVIMNAGDEVRLRFRAPPETPPGWKRDFVWVSDGWTKDGNLNTGFSKTVLPLPYHKMKSYDRPPGALEDDPVYQKFPEDWRKYHTRYVTPDVFEQGLRSFRRPRP